MVVSQNNGTSKTSYINHLLLIFTHKPSIFGAPNFKKPPSGKLEDTTAGENGQEEPSKLFLPGLLAMLGLC